MRFQFVLKAITVALLFGGGIPLLYPVATCSLGLAYLIDKYNGGQNCFMSTMHTSTLTRPHVHTHSRASSHTASTVLRVYRRPAHVDERVCFFRRMMICCS